LLRTNNVSFPLTIDWLTVTWLELRVSLWWRRQRWLIRVLALLALATGCVPVTQFEESQSAAQVEAGGRERAESQLAAQRAENAALRERLAQQGATLEQREQALAQAELDGSVQGKEREEAAGMVEQLRGELARTAGHLQAFQDDKQKLEASRTSDAERSRALALVTRDIALLLATPIATGQYSLDAEPARVVLRVPRDQVLVEDGSLKPDAAPLVKAIARALQSNGTSKLRVEDTSAPLDPLKVASVVAALGEQQITSERFESLVAPADVDVAPAPVAAPAPAPEAPVVAAAPAAAPELVFAFSVP
jgi:hypothetical protein